MPDNTTVTVSASRSESVTVEVTADGYLRLSPEFSRDHFSHDRCVGLRLDETSFVVMPVTPVTPNALIMKQRSLAGERSVLIREVWGDDHPVGTLEASWMPGRRRLVLKTLSTPPASGEAGSRAAASAQNTPETTPQNELQNQLQNEHSLTSEEHE
ncbi:hypothetical protein KPL76_10150 [Subtercola sp. PAMC28395]|uniref:hypothetical protein n=1 Tax=Subtercola sp. PAMC28395 TaxID=2846775 RepID=UPI001C0B3C6A|nr:hypothetical protein [Subtercola sp. PAMC28395]QWT23110.1 hypothetical protein KPL76_10150 [Subtercola sp. PAMC28395]